MSNPCIEAHAPHLATRFNELVKIGMSDREAGRKAAMEDFAKLNGDLNAFKESIGIELTEDQKAGYKEPNNSAKVKEITDAYADKIKALEYKPAQKEPPSVSEEDAAAIADKRAKELAAKNKPTVISEVVGSGVGGDVNFSEKDLQDNGVSFIKGASHLAKENGISNESNENGKGGNLQKGQENGQGGSQVSGQEISNQSQKENVGNTASGNTEAVSAVQKPTPTPAAKPTRSGAAVVAPSVQLKPKVGDKVFDTKQNKEATITKVSKPAKGSAQEKEPFLMDLKYADGKRTANMPVGDRFIVGGQKQESNTNEDEGLKVGQNILYKGEPMSVYKFVNPVTVLLTDTKGNTVEVPANSKNITPVNNKKDEKAPDKKPSGDPVEEKEQIIENKAQDAEFNKDPQQAAAVIDEINAEIEKDAALIKLTPEQQARDKGEKTIDGTVVKRQSKIAALVGKAVNILFAKDDTQEGNYAVIDLADMQPSHKSGIKNEKHFIPEAQPRDRGGLTVLKNEAKTKADNLDPNQLADNNIAYFGSPVINELGEVIQGNGRAEAIDYYYNNNKTDSKGYKAMLMEKAASLGLDPAAISKIKNPVLVRVVKVSDERAIVLGNKTASELEDVKQKGADIKAAMGGLSQAKIQELSKVINAKTDENSTLKSIIRDNAKAIIDKLFSLGALRADNREQYFGQDGVTPEGIQKAYDIVRQLLFTGGDTDLQQKFDNLPFAQRQGIEKVIPAILSNPALKGRVQEAIGLMYEAQEGGAKDFDTWQRSRDAFGDQLAPMEKFDINTLKFAKELFNATTQKEISTKIAEIAQKMNGSIANLYEAAVPGQSFVQAIGGVVPVAASAAIAVDRAILSVKKGEINADDAAIQIDESGIEVTNEIYDKLRDAEKQFIKSKTGLQVGDMVTVKGRNGVADFSANFRGVTKDGDLVVVAIGTGGTFVIKPDEIIPTEQAVTPVVENKDPKEKPAADIKKAERKVRNQELRKEIDDLADDFFKDDGNITSGGISPEKIEKGTKLIGLYLKDGWFKFSDIIEDLYAKYGEKIRPFFDAMKQVYGGYFNSVATDEEAAKMDGNLRGFTLDSIISKFNSNSTPKRSFIDTVKGWITNKEKTDIRGLRKLADGLGIDVKDTTLQEYVEVAVVELGREIAQGNLTEAQKLEAITELYYSQPSITMRSAEKIEKQQYSTPVPLGFIAGLYVGNNNPKSVLEPSGGNGMLLINFAPSIVTANEIDPVRLENLQEQGFGNVTNQDAMQPFNIGLQDGVVMNPPFGSSPEVVVDGYRINGLDEKMIVNALSNLAPNGKAAIIMGGHNRYDDKGRLISERIFFNYLYSHYNVEEVVNVDGQLYQKQGTTFPIRIILINGVKEVKQGLPPINNNNETVPVAKSFNDVYNIIKLKNEENGKQNILSPGLVPNVGNGAPVYVPGSRPGNANGQGRLFDIPAGEVRPAGGAVNPAGGTPGNARPGVSGGANLQPNANGNSAGDNGNGGLLGQAGSVFDRQEQAPDNGDGGNAGVPGDIVATAPRSFDDLTQAKVQYRPKSKSSFSVNAVIPSPMATEMEKVLTDFENKYGPVDDYVMSKLKYANKEALFKAFSAEQIDALALSIAQIDRGEGMIIGDMTGVGKGRVAAGVIRYANAIGLKPIFITLQPNLFSDFYRDLVDIGSADLVPFIVNSPATGNTNPAVVKEDGTVVHKPLPTAAKNSALASGVINADFIMATYSQFNSAGPTAKKAFLQRAAVGNIVVLDESHTISGDSSNVGLFFQDVIAETKGVTYLSATFAKQPENMPVYALKTDMKEANMSMGELIDAIKHGGVALQEIVGAQLVESGQMMRRESQPIPDENLSFDVLDDYTEEHSKAADEVTEIIRDVIDFQKAFVAPAISALDDAAVEAGARIAGRNGTNEAGVNNTPFASKVFQVVHQLLFSIKAEAVGHSVVAALKEGLKPVIAFNSTMGSFLEHIEAKDGDILANADFALTLDRSLDGVMKYTEKNHVGEKINKELSVSDLSPAGQQMYKYIKAKIKKASSGITISPIDAMIEVIESAGYKIGEITGRKMTLRKNADGSYTAEARVGVNKNRNLNMFNNGGGVDVLLINESGATGLSIHASSKFKDQRQRKMFIVQNQLDIAKAVQMMGRIDRTGQVVRGLYSFVVSNIPAEQRLLMMFKRKLKSLNANATASQKSKEENASEIEDFLNKYGDQIVFDYLVENTTLNALLMDPLKIEENNSEEGDTAPEGAASKVTGKVAILPVAEQAKFYNEISERYKAEIKYLDDNNSNDLEVKVLPLNAETVNSAVVIMGNGNGSFGSDTILEKVEVDVLKMPLTKAEIDEETNNALDGKTPQESSADLRQSIEDYYDKQIAEENAELEQRYEDKKADTEAAVRAKEGQEGYENMDQEVADAFDRLTFEKNEKQQRVTAKYETSKSFMARMANYFKINSVYDVPTAVDATLISGSSKGVFLGFLIKEKKTGNPYAPSAVTARFAVNDGRRVVSLPLSKRQFIDAIIAQTHTNIFPGQGKEVRENWDTHQSQTTRKARFMITGNILQGYATNRGSLISYTTTKGEMRKGMLLREDFQITEQRLRIPINQAANYLKKAGNTITSINGDVTIRNTGSQIAIEVPLSKSAGGKYFLDNNLRDLLSSRGFNQSGNRMQGFTETSQLQDVLDYFTNAHNLNVEVVAAAQAPAARPTAPAANAPANTPAANAPAAPANTPAARPPAAPPSAPSAANKPAIETVSAPVEHVHSKTGQVQYVSRISANSRLERDEFLRLKGVAQKNGGTYSSFPSARGFLFDKKEDADNFVKEINTAPESKFSSKDEFSDFQTTDKAPATVEALSKKYPDAVVVKSQSELPAKVLEDAKAQGVKEIEGVLHNGKIYLVADNLSTMGRAEGVYRHESIGHQGVIAVLKTKLGTFVNQLIDNATEAQLRGFNKLSQRLYGKNVDQLNTQQKNTLGQEYIAIAAEKPGSYATTWEKIKSFVRSVLRDLGIKISVSDNDIKVLLDRAAKFKTPIAAGTIFSMKMPDGSIKQVKALGVDVVNGFYSPLEKVINESKADKMPAKQWIEKFARGEEAKWTGLTDWLNQQGSVSKADIQQYLKDNRIQVVEVVKGSEEKQVKYKQLSDMPNAIYGFAERFIETGDKKFLAEIEKEGYTIHYDNNGEVDYFTKEGKTFVTDPTKFSQYQTEGEKSNYKEVLVTMPSKGVRPISKWEFYEREGYTQQEFEQAPKDFQQKLFDKWKAETSLQVVNKSEQFKSSHFDEANILVHLRMNTRTDAEGKKVLFLEEVQSDWGQKGKKEGFAQPKQEFDKNKVEITRNDRTVVVNYDGKRVGVFDKENPTFNKSDAELTEMLKKDLNDEYDKYTQHIKGQVANAPFVTDTNAWTKLGLKVALKEAVKQGADKIAWTTGEQQNARYDLSKSVDLLYWNPNSEMLYAYKNGNTGSGKPRWDEVIKKEVAKEDLPNVIGKDIAQKLLDAPINGNQHELKGEQLKIGGRGMKGFYGSPTEGSLGIVGNVAKSLFKQEPKTVEIEIQPKKFDIKYEPAWWSQKDKSGNYEVYSGTEHITTTERGDANSEKSAIEYAKQYYSPKSYNISFNSKEEFLSHLETLKKEKANIISSSDATIKSTQHSIDITPELIAQVQEGQSLFSSKELDDRLKKLREQRDGVQNEEPVVLPKDLKAYADSIIDWVKGETPDATAADVIAELEPEEGKEFTKAEKADLFKYVAQQMGGIAQPNAGQQGTNTGQQSNAGQQQSTEPEQDDSGQDQDDNYIKNFTITLSEKAAPNESLRTDIAAGYSKDVLDQDDMVDSLELDFAISELNDLVAAAKNRFGEQVIDYAKGLYNHFKNLEDDITKLAVMVKLKNDLDNERKLLDDSIQELKRNDPANAEISNLTAEREDIIKQLRQVARYVDEQGAEASKKFNILRLTKKLRFIGVASKSMASIVGKDTQEDANDISGALDEPIENEEDDDAEEDGPDPVPPPAPPVAPAAAPAKTPSKASVSKAKASLERIKNAKSKLANLSKEFNKILEDAKKLC